MNIRERLFLHTNLNSEQIHVLEKFLEHNCFCRAFYEELSFVIPGRNQDQVVVIKAEDSLLSVAISEDETLASLVKEGTLNQPGASTSAENSYAPLYFGENHPMAIVTYREKVASAAPDLQKFAEDCRQGKFSDYPASYLVPDGIVLANSQEDIEFSNYVAQCICSRVGIAQKDFNGVIEGLGSTITGRKGIQQEPAFFGECLQIGEFDLSLIVMPLLCGKLVLGSLAVISDLTLIKKKERELIKKSTVIKEIHHRVKNNLQTITSLLRLQMRRTKSKAVEKAFNESINRILSIALIHEALSHQEIEIINIKQTVYKMLDMILSNMVAPNKAIFGEIYGSDVYLTPLQASHLSLCVTELIQNAVEHAFEKQTEGVIRVTVEKHGNEVQVTVEDNGQGIPSGRIEELQSLGLQIVNNITLNNLSGTFTLKGTRKGTVAQITFPSSIREGGEGD